MKHSLILLFIMSTAVRADVIRLWESEAGSLSFDTQTGAMALRDAGGRTIIGNIRSSLRFKPGRGTTIEAASSETAGKTPVKSEFTDKLGAGTLWALPEWPDRGGNILVSTRVKSYAELPFFVVESSMKVIGGEPAEVTWFNPLDASQFELDADAGKVWFIENGSDATLDIYVRRMRADSEALSNGNIAFYAPGADSGLVLGFLSHSVAYTRIRTQVEKGERPIVKQLIAHCLYTPAKIVKPGETLDAESGLSVELTKGQPVVAMERWAANCARTLGHDPYGEGNLVKWCSWYAKYNRGMTEGDFIKELDAARTKLQPYGMSYFGMDAGWERAEGDWEAGERYPGGMKAAADRIHEAGFKAGIWCAPFSGSPGSEICRQHPDWFLQPKGLTGRLVGGGNRALDISKPEVLEHLDKLLRKITREWGYDYVKCDFLYLAMVQGGFGRRDRTRTEVYRSAFDVMRKAMGPGRLLYVINVPNIAQAGCTNVIRLGLDNSPVWNKAGDFQEQGLRTSVRTLSRRYYLNGNLWINHPDVLYTGDPDTAGRWGCPPLPLNEARAWDTLCALNGGVMCVGDSIMNLAGQRLDLIRRIIPQYKGVARPLDLFEHCFAEVWNLRVERPFEAWNVVGVFHWGENERYGEPMPDAPREKEINFADLGLDPAAEYCVYEFWTDEWLGVRKGGVRLKMEPHSCKLLCVRKAAPHPQFVSVNRHFTQGGLETDDVKWDAAAKTLSCSQRVIGGWEYAVSVRVPPGFRPVEARLSFNAPYELIHEKSDLYQLRFESHETVPSGEWVIRFE
ncbi:MAG TPA: alpha-galactosidase [Candidatus Brocadiia bacterium]|nr:alpha-galactosidase [Candidatus Brocadiia bacterium]